jgi:hypothetical protein
VTNFHHLLHQRNNKLEHFANRNGYSLNSSIHQEEAKSSLLNMNLIKLFWTAGNMGKNLVGKPYGENINKILMNLLLTL